MLVCLNGQFVPEEEAVVSVFDRGFLYGDGLFETIRVLGGQPFRWAQHLARLRCGAEFLKIRPAFSSEEIRELADRLITENHVASAVLRLTLSRGAGVRGYSPSGAEHPTLVMSLHPVAAVEAAAPLAWRLITSALRLPAGDPLAQFKTCNKLPQILARAEAEAAKAQEALLLNTDGHVVEAASSNLFWVRQEFIYTPPLASGILPGVTRAVLAELCRNLRVPFREADITREQLLEADGVFLSLSSIGIAEGVALDGQPLARSALTARLRVAYLALLRAESE